MHQLFKFDSNEWNTYFFLLFAVISIAVTILIKEAKRLEKNGEKSRARIVITIAFAVLFFFSAFRSIDVGTDTADYAEIYSSITWTSIQQLINHGCEPLFAYYMYVLHCLSDSVLLLFVMNSIITNMCFFKYVNTFWKANDSYAFFPLFIINYVYGLSAMRFALSLALVLASLAYQREHKNVMALICAVLAALFHNTALVNIGVIAYKMLFNKNAKLSTVRKNILLSITSFIVFFVSITVLQQILLNTHYQGYVRELGSGWLGNWNVVLAFIISIYLLYKNWKNKEYNASEEIDCLLTFSMLPLIVRLGAYRFPMFYLMSRLGVYNKYIKRFECKQRNLWLFKALEYMLVAIALLYYFSRIRYGMTYSFIWKDL